MLFQEENYDRNLISHTKNRFLYLFLIIAIFAAAFGIRCYRITEPDIYNHPVRQYHSYNIARTFYHLNNEQVEDWRRELAEAKYKNLDFKEPPLLEYIVAKTYLLADDEYLWIPKLFSISFWLIGGILLYRLLVRFAAPLSAILALAYYLFLPFGFFVSRSFQPESLMTMFFIASVLMIYRYFEKPSTKRLILSALVSSAAILIKFIPLFPISTAFLFMSFSKHNKDKTPFIKKSFVFLLITALPSLLYYSYMYFNSGPIHSAATSIFLPDLLISSFFWKGWLHMFGVTIGLIAAACSMAGMVILKSKRAKTLLAGLWIGYFVYGLIFSYTTATHDYYQVLLAPIAALSIAPVCQHIIKSFCKFSRKWQFSLAVLAIITPLLLLNYLKNIKHDQFFEINDNLKHKLEFVCDIVGVNPHRLKKINHDYNNEVEILRHIGSAVNHSTNTIILDKNYGHPVIYFSEVIGTHWPNKEQVAYLKNVAKAESISAQTRFDNIFKKSSPEYFIITDIKSLEFQPELKRLLDTQFEILDKDDNFMIYDLKKRLPLKSN
jgi:Dolichyl-phosphate-mannose-protein mannosyltransferase